MSQTHQFNVDIIRSFIRLKSMFVSFYVDAPTTSAVVNGKPVFLRLTDSISGQVVIPPVVSFKTRLIGSIILWGKTMIIFTIHLMSFNGTFL